ncbi:MAG: fumarylacetoacetate hydrolase family protein [Chloroflexi bacterium]|nr:fumarylacetoacetate hydrolase family protein [Chloroflexota bacterium]
MRLTQLAFPSFGSGTAAIHAALIEGDRVVDIACPDARQTHEYVALAARQRRPLADVVAEGRRAAGGYTYRLPDLAGGMAPNPRLQLTIPISPPEVWGCGVTYRRSAEFRDEDTASTARGIYDYVYSAPRPEVFFKATAARCVGPDEPIGVRSDSTFTAPEPELAFVLASTGEIVGFTIANDVSAWDIERENPLYLPQSKIYQGCAALGPVVVTPDEIGDPNNLLLRCRIWRSDAIIFEGEVNTSRIGRSFDQLVHYLTLDNPVPDGTVVCTGTGVIVERRHALADGDVVEIEVEKIGLLRNPVRRLPRR